MDEQFNEEAKHGWRFAADEARITDEKASSEDRKHPSERVFESTDGNLGAVIGKEEGAARSFPGNEGRIAQAWGDCARRSARRCASLFRILLALRRLDTKN